MVFVGTQRGFLAATVLFVLLARQRRTGESVTTSNVDLTEYSIKLDKSEVPAGEVRFVAKNVGQLKHELIVLKSRACRRPVAVQREGAEGGRGTGRPSAR